MIDIYSPSGKEEELVEYCFDYLQEHGLKPELMEIEEGRSNVILWPEENAQVVFVGHLDTVPAFDLERYESRVEEDLIWGLGAADMKGGCAALIEAFVAWGEVHGSPPPAALALVLGEEETGDGVHALNQTRRFPWSIVAEPTELCPCLGHYGYLEMRLTALGERRHASMSSDEHNAIRVLLAILQSLTRYMDKERTELVYNIRDVHSSEAGFAVPDRCEAWIDIHIPPRLEVEKVQKDLLGIVNSTPGDPKASFPTVHRGYQLEDRGLVPELLKDFWKLSGWKWLPSVFPSDSDAVLLNDNGTQSIILGPGRLARAHSPAEAVSFEQVRLGAEIYLDLLERLTEKTQ
jgi:acetylornithine deacetylase